ncbi:MAG TPA: diguanylate cyclase, partial [Gammaproteobacteria bacterium]|nr:diguanylate cyclase [Gammaproteobacteria bacterium]
EETNRYTAVILFTAKEGVDALVEAFERGVDDYLTKPLDERELAARVHAAGRISTLQNTQLETSAALTRFNRQLQELATTDPLTGLGNRRYLESRLNALLLETTARGGATCCVMIDIDHFKAVNDRYGHDVGDEVLKSLATRLRRAVRPTDIVVRMGGEEFAVVMHYPDIRLNVGIFERILETIQERPIITSAGAVALTISMGVCCHTHGTLPAPEALLKCADEKLYAAKEAGRNRVVY